MSKIDNSIQCPIRFPSVRFPFDSRHHSLLSHCSFFLFPHHLYPYYYPISFLCHIFYSVVISVDLTFSVFLKSIPFILPTSNQGIVQSNGIDKIRNEDIIINPIIINEDVITAQLQLIIIRRRHVSLLVLNPSVLPTSNQASITHNKAKACFTSYTKSVRSPDFKSR